MFSFTITKSTNVCRKCFSFLRRNLSDEREKLKTEHLQLLEEVSKKLEIKEWEDWYNVFQKQFIKSGGLKLVLYYGTFQSALKKLLPQHPWKTWNFAIGIGYLNNFKSQREFLDEIAKQLNIKHWEDWYSITKAEIEAKGGAYLLRCFNDSPQQLLSQLYPEYPWIIWKFNAVPDGYWKDKQNARNFMEDLANKLGIKQPQDWYNISLKDLSKNGASSIIAHYKNSLPFLLSSIFPEYKWENMKPGRRSSKSQDRLHVVLIDVFPQFDIHMNYLFCDGTEPFELDFYIPAIKLGFEFQGEQHFEHVSLYDSKASMKKDNVKRILCANANVTLIEVPYWWNKQKESLIATIHKSRQDLKLIQGDETKYKPIPEKP